MTNSIKRLLSLAIAVIMMISLLPVSVFAETLPQAKVTKLPATTLQAGEYMVWPSGDDTVARPLEIAVNFEALDSLEDCIASGYADWLVDFNITVRKLSGDSIVADNCYLAGNYGEFNWVVIPTDGMELSNGVYYPVVSAYDASLNYKDICKSVKNFTAAIHIDEAILEANPGMEIALKLVMTNPENTEETLQIGDELVYTAKELSGETAPETKLPQAEVTELSALTLQANEYRVWNGVVSDNESEALVPGNGQMPLEVALNFKAIDSLEECLTGGYAKWLVDFYITVNGLENDTFEADNCYLAGNYGSYGLIKIPLDNQIIEEGVTYPVVAIYDPTLNYKDICKSVKDFTAALHIDQAVLDANPDITVTLQLVMTNPDNTEDTLQIGGDYVYGFESLKNSTEAEVAMNKETQKIYASVADAIAEAQTGETVVMLCDFSEDEILVKRDITLDLNGHDLYANDVTSPYNTAHIVDSTDGQGVLVVEKEYLTIHNGNAYLPVWVEEGEISGYRFTKVELNQSLKVLVNGDAYFRFYIKGNDADCALQQAVADGGTDNFVAVQVKLSWTDINGNSGNNTYEYADEKLIEYAEDWTGNEFRLTVTGMEKVKELHVTATVVSEATGSDGVIIAGDTKTITK